MELNIMEIGKMINRKDLDKKNGKMELFKKDNINLVKSKEKAHSFGAMTALMKEILIKIIFMELENMFGKTGAYIKDNG